MPMPAAPPTTSRYEPPVSVPSPLPSTTAPPLPAGPSVELRPDAGPPAACRPCADATYAHSHDSAIDVAKDVRTPIAAPFLPAAPASSYAPALKPPYGPISEQSNRSDAAPGCPPACVELYTATATLTVEWPLQAETVEQAVLAAEAVRKKILAASNLMGGKAAEKLPADEQELLDEQPTSRQPPR